jgi:hypothetical protein
MTDCRGAVGDNAAVKTEPSKAAPPKRKRRWFQFSLRTLLVFTVVCAIGSAWVARKMEQKRDELKTVEDIVESGGQVFYDYQILKGGEPPGPDWLRKLLGENFFSEVVGVNLDYAHVKINDVWLLKVKRLPRLQWLSLVDTDVTDVGLANLKGMTRLEKLYLGNTQVTDAGLVQLKEFFQLKALYLKETRVTDAGVLELQRELPNCKIER